MAAPEYVPTATIAATDKAYASPDRRGGGWFATRPGDVVHKGQPTGEGMGYQGPDQGYALRLARLFETDIRLAEGEHRADVLAGCVAVAMRRASLFGRAPMRDDVEIALTLFGFLDEEPDRAMVDWRKPRFAELAHTAQHYSAARELVTGVPEEALRLSLAEVRLAYDRSWQALHGV